MQIKAELLHVFPIKMKHYCPALGIALELLGENNVEIQIDVLQLFGRNKAATQNCMSDISTTLFFELKNILKNGAYRSVQLHLL